MPPRRAGGQPLHPIYAPLSPTGQPAWRTGTRAKQLTSELAFGKVVRVEPTDRDQYGRIVADVILPDGRNLNRELVRAGLAWWYRHYAPHDAELCALEVEARAAQRGLWAEPHPIPPWDWRRGAVAQGGAPSPTCPTAGGWLLKSPVEAASAEDQPVTLPLDEGPVVQPYPNGDTCERAREEQLSAALRVAKATDADAEAEVTAQVWQRTLAASAARCVPAP